jgi:putrescine transport system ATP-binding protein
VLTDVEAARGAAIWFAIRPEKLRLRLDPPAERMANLAEGTVCDMGYLGDWTAYRVRLADGTLLRVSRANVPAVERRPAREDRVWLDWEPEAGLVLTQ